MNRKELTTLVKGYCRVTNCNDCRHGNGNDYSNYYCTIGVAWSLLKQRGILKEPEPDFSEMEVDTLLLIKKCLGII